MALTVPTVADAVRTIVVDPTLEKVGVFGIIVVIRILLSFSGEVEIDGLWPRRRRPVDRHGRQGAPAVASREHLNHLGCAFARLQGGHALGDALALVKRQRPLCLYTTAVPATLTLADCICVSGVTSSGTGGVR